MNSTYGYIFLLIGIAILIVAISFWLAKSQNNNGIRFSKILNKDSDPANLNGSGKKILNEEVNEIRIPKQAELDLPDENEDNLIYHISFDNEDFLIVSSTIKSNKNYLNLKDLNKEVIKNYFFTRHFMPLENTCYKNLRIVYCCPLLSLQKD